VEETVKAALDFLKITLTGGILIVLPAWLSILLVMKSIGVLTAVVRPVTVALPERARHPWIGAVALLLAGCFFAGLAARTAAGQWVKNLLEQKMFGRLPGYTVVRSVTRQVADVDEDVDFDSALVELEEALVPAFIVEHHADGQYTVFVPSAPTPAMGTIYVLPRNRVHPVDVPFLTTMRCVTQWGVGTGQLLAAMQSGGTRS
jgi:uncharacterized membrane protein